MSIGWGFIGAGRFTPKVVGAVAATTGHDVVCIASRSLERSRVIAEEFGAAACTYADLWADDRVDVVHITTTHPFHEEQALATIAAGKAVVVEKPMAMDADSAQRIADAAREAGVFAAEAMWLRHQPLIKDVLELVRSGEIGRVVSVQADFGVLAPYDPDSRLFDLANGGGALLDLGVYAAAFAWPFLGRPDTVSATGVLTPQGSDLTAAMQWGYTDGRFAQLTATFASPSPGRGLITGDQGWISVEPHYAKGPTLALLHTGGRTREVRAESRGYIEQVDEVGRCLRKGLVESPHMPLEDTIGVLDVLSRARADLGVRYPGEGG